MDCGNRGPEYSCKMYACGNCEEIEKEREWQNDYFFPLDKCLFSPVLPHHE